MAKINFDNGTSKQRRKFDGYGVEYSLKKSKIENIRELLRKFKFKMAKNCIDNYIKEYGEDCYIYHELGKYYNSIDEQDEAIKYFSKVIDNRYKNMYYSMYELSKIEKTKLEYDKAIDHLNTIINSNHPEKCHAKLELAKVYFIINDWIKSKKLLKEIIDNKEPNSLYALDSLIEYSYAYKDKKTAINYYEKLKDELEPNRNNYYKATIEIMKGDILEGKKQLEEMSTDDINLKIKIIYQLALINYDLENYNKAINYMLELTRIDSKSINYSFIVSIYIRLKDYDNALKYLNEIMGKDYYSLEEISLLKGNMCFMKKEYDDALKYYSKIKPSNTTTYRDSLYKQICIHLKLNEYETVLELYNELKKYDYNKKYDYLYKTNSLEILCNHRLGLENEIDASVYTDNQIVDYNIERTLEHISFHKEENENKTLHSVFDESINITDLFVYSFLNLKEENYYANNIMDIYVIEYPNVGTVNGEVVNYVKVVTLPNTKEIITIFPYNKSIKENKNENTKVKQMSRIDKFNKKYNL